MKLPQSALRHLLIVIMSLTITVLAGCAKGTTTLSPPTARPSDDALYVLEHLQLRQEPVRANYYDRSLVERLPNVLFSISGGKPERLGAGIVAGDVLEVSAGRGYVADEDDAGGTAVSFDSPDAKWRTLTVTMSTTDKWGYTGGSASFGLAFDGGVDRDRMLRGVRELGKVVVGLGPQGFFEQDKSLYRVARNGSLIGQVDSAGSFTLPALGESEAAYLDGVRTVAAIDRAAKDPTRTIQIEGGVRSR